jgi:hypothetical protein
MGDPNNRYMLYGFAVHSADLFKFDQLIWALRRHCRPFTETHAAGAENNIEINWIEQLKKRPGLWRLGTNLLIEKLADKEPSTPMGEALITLNLPFAPDRNHTVTVWRTSSATAPLEELVSFVAKRGSGPRSTAACQEHSQLGR